jgi:hypothetical protein
MRDELMLADSVCSSNGWWYRTAYTFTILSKISYLHTLGSYTILSFSPLTQNVVYFTYGAQGVSNVTLTFLSHF